MPSNDPNAPRRPLTAFKVFINEFRREYATKYAGIPFSQMTDIGEAIGCGAHVTQLRRTFVSPFEQRPMVDIDTIESLSDAPSSELDKLLLPLDAGLAHLAAVVINVDGVATFNRGQSPICQLTQPAASSEPALCRVYDDSTNLIGLGELEESGEQVAPRRVLQFS